MHVIAVIRKLIDVFGLNIVDLRRKRICGLVLIHLLISIYSSFLNCSSIKSASANWPPNARHC